MTDCSCVFQSEAWMKRETETSQSLKSALLCLKRFVCSFSRTYHAYLSGHQVTQSVEPADVGLQVAGFAPPEETLTKKNKGKESINTHESPQSKRYILVFKISNSVSHFFKYFIVFSLKLR